MLLQRIHRAFGISISWVVLCCFLITPSNASACDKRILVKIWEGLKYTVTGGWLEYGDPAFLQVYTGRATLHQSKDAYDVFRRGIFENQEISLADRDLLEKEGEWRLYESLKNAPRWVKIANLWIGATERSQLHPQWEIDKAIGNLTGSIPALRKKLDIGDLIYKAYVYKTGTYFTPSEIERMKIAGTDEAFVRKMASELNEGIKDYEELRKQWEGELWEQQKHMAGTFGKAPFHLLRTLLFIPNIPKEHKLDSLEGKITADPKAPLKSPETFFEAPHFNEVDFVKNTHGLIQEVERLRKEVEEHPELYRNARNLRELLKWTVRGLALAGMMTMKWGLDQIDLTKSFDQTAPEGMHPEDVDDGIVELIYYPDSAEAAIRIGPKIYHYGWGSMAKIDSIKMYASFAISKGDHVRVKIKMTHDEILKLKNYLEEQKNRNVLNLPPLSSPTGVASQDLQRGSGVSSVPTIVDRTHATAIPFLEVRNLMEKLGIGEDRIQGIIYASPNGQGRSALQLAGDGLQTLYMGNQPGKAYFLYPLAQLVPKGPTPPLEPVIPQISTDEAKRKLEASLPWPDDPSFIEKLTTAVPEEKEVLLSRYREWMAKKARE